NKFHSFYFEFLCIFSSSFGHNDTSLSNKNPNLRKCPLFLYHFTAYLISVRFFGVIFLGNKLLRKEYTSVIAQMYFIGRWELRRWIGWLAMIARFKKLEGRNIRLLWGVGGILIRKVIAVHWPPYVESIIFTNIKMHP
ncbi:hypothetical protein, partial [Desulfopila inferna]|uniref:hypothetical protein n=1 Tax=Desulfopila inferna TaxID=468528 RepID=UPI0019658F2F